MATDALPVDQGADGLSPASEASRESIWKLICFEITYFWLRLLFTTLLDAATAKPPSLQTVLFCDKSVLSRRPMQDGSMTLADRGAS